MLRALMMTASLFAGITGPPVGRPVSLKSTDADGAVLLAVAPMTALFSPSSFDIEMGVYSPEQQVFKTSSFGGWATIGGIPVQQTGFKIVGRRLKPGVYAIMAITARPFGSCFNASSVSFEIKPGVATVLGALDPNPAVLAYGRAVARHEAPGVARTNGFNYVYDIPAPRLLPAALQPGDEQALRALNPELTAPIEAAALTPIAFKTGRDLLNLGRLCGGYYADRSATPPPPVPARFDKPAGRFVRVWVPAETPPPPAPPPTSPPAPRGSDNGLATVAAPPVVAEGRTLDLKLNSDGSLSEVHADQP